MSSLHSELNSATWPSRLIICPPYLCDIKPLIHGDIPKFFIREDLQSTGKNSGDIAWKTNPKNNRNSERITPSLNLLAQSIPDVRRNATKFIRAFFLRVLIYFEKGIDDISFESCWKVFGRSECVTSFTDTRTVNLNLAFKKLRSSKFSNRMHV